MEEITPRTMVWKSTYDLVVISPATTSRPVAISVSQATRLVGSSVRQASRMASEIWSAILSGCPSVTDSDVKRYGFFDDNAFTPLKAMERRTRRGNCLETSPLGPIKKYQRTRLRAMEIGPGSHPKQQSGNSEG